MSAKAQLAAVILRQIESLGYDVAVHRQGGNVTVTARERATGETHSVTMPKADIYLAACELAASVGVELEGA